MVAYRNASSTTKTFYNVTFKPGATKEVPGYINDAKFIRVNPEAVKTNVSASKEKKVASTSTSPSKPVESSTESK